MTPVSIGVWLFSNKSSIINYHQLVLCFGIPHSWTHCAECSWSSATLKAPLITGGNSRIRPLETTSPPDIVAKLLRSLQVEGNFAASAERSPGIWRSCCCPSTVGRNITMIFPYRKGPLVASWFISLSNSLTIYYITLYNYIYSYNVIYNYNYILLFYCIYIWVHMITYDYMWLHMIIYQYYISLYIIIYQYYISLYIIKYHYILLYIIKYHYIILLYIIIYHYIW